MRTHEDFESRARSAREHALDEIDVEIEAGDAKGRKRAVRERFPGVAALGSREVRLGVSPRSHEQS